MVILFSKRKSKIEEEIIEILLKYGGDYITDKKIIITDSKFTLVSKYKYSEITLKKGIAVFCDDTDRFEKQELPQNMIGICEENNKTALELFKKNCISVITCGMNSKNTVTLSSLNDNTLLTSLQRTVTDSKGTDIMPSEFKVKLNKKYNPFAVMACVAVLLINGIMPTEF